MIPMVRPTRVDTGGDSTTHVSTGVAAHLGGRVAQNHRTMSEAAATVLLSSLLSACELPAQTTDTILSRALTNLQAAGVAAPAPASHDGSRGRRQRSDEAAASSGAFGGGSKRTTAVGWSRPSSRAAGGGESGGGAAERAERAELELRESTARCAELEQQVAAYKQRAAQLAREKVSTRRNLSSWVSSR